MKKNTAIVRARRFLECTRGANLVEYIILVGVVAVFCLGVFKTFGETAQTKVKNQTGAVQGVPDKVEQ
ncbi:MAG TPA: hypothetical protein VM925_06775 [Labilithrix sp.]|nr:hypothetical protein [Labilithrix sp.]